MIKNKYVLMLLSLATVSVSSFAQTNSAGGILTFSGAITDTTCTINGGNSDSLTILLNPITVAEAGIVANKVITTNQKSFDLSFSDCAPVADPATKLKIRFSSANISNSGLYLVNTLANENDPAVAKNVGFSISTTAARAVAIPLNTPFNTGIDGNLTGGESETLSLVASYYKSNVASARIGAIQSSVIYTVSYL